VAPMMKAVRFVLSIWMSNPKKSNTREQDSEESERNRLSDEYVLKAKADFEMRLDENVDLPDGIGWRKAYVYRNLMSKWFDSLIAKYRYDETISTNIKSDWLEYMYLLESESTSRFLSFGSINANDKESYEQTARLEYKQYVAIEDGFAGAIGNEAIEELRRVREAPHDAFDRSGRKPMASIGYSYVPVSLRPYDEELRPQP
jgi:hypothetical protein